MYEASIALNGLSCFVTSDLARDLANDLMSLLGSIRPYVKKHAILVMYKVFLNFPDALRPAFPRLKDKLEDPDPGVQSAAVNVICELARRNPRNYLSLAPVFFKLMTSSTNNWMLIKIIKLFGALSPLEPRLGKKLTEPLTNLIHSTSAMSLLYECVNTMIAAVPNHTASMQLCVTKLKVMIEDPDQNLKYLGLLSLGRILKHHPKVVQAHKDMILTCLEDKDESIRLRCLDLLYGMVTKKNLVEVTKKLMIHMDHAEGSAYRDELVCKITEICSQGNYHYITNFEWYISVLVELTKVEGTRHGRLLADQMLDVAIRVKTVRPYAVKQMAVLLDNMHLLSRSPGQQGVSEVLYAAAWVCGEFSEFLDDMHSTLNCMLKPKVMSLPGYVQGVFVHNVIKLYSHMLSHAVEQEDDVDKVEQMNKTIQEKLVGFVSSADLEVQERASSAIQLLKYANKLREKGVDIVGELAALFDGELCPVAPKAQRKVPVPEGLDLEKWINDPPSESEDDSKFSMESAFFDGDVSPGV
jgi:AP-3 complex subunit delta-1